MFRKYLPFIGPQLSARYWVRPFLQYLLRVELIKPHITDKDGNLSLERNSQTNEWRRQSYSKILTLSSTPHNPKAVRVEAGLTRRRTKYVCIQDTSSY